MTPTHQKLFDTLKAYQPLTKDELVVLSGCNPKTIGNWLTSEYVKRCSVGLDGRARMKMQYWLDDEFKPVLTRKLKVEPFEHHPIMQALYGGLNASWRH